MLSGVAGLVAGPCGGSGSASASLPAVISNDSEPNVTLRPLDGSRRETTTTEIARRLLEYFLAGHFEPGHRLPSERKLAETLGVGRSVVREALKSLTLLGIVEVRQGDGTFLRSAESDLLPHAIEWGLLLGTRRTRDLIEARLYLESILAELAAERRDATDLEELRRELDGMYGAKDDRAAFVAADVAFHLRVAKAAGNETFLQIMVSVRALLQVWMARVVYSAEDLAVLAAEHAPIYDAVAAQDRAAARAAMDAHLKQAFARLEVTLASDPASASAGS
jgi:GntR family transcriptional regulator, transcriptional repressor for pyruvate dehydrogenase complex